jgi:hypothetical protein
LFEQATGQRGDGGAAVTAGILGKTRMRWKETAITEIELRQKNQLSPEERAKRARQLLDEVFAEVTAEKAGADTANR